jgi:hypothetical protein
MGKQWAPEGYFFDIDIRLLIWLFQVVVLSRYSKGNNTYCSEDIEVMRIVLRDEMTTELTGEVLTGITQVVER